SQNREVLDQYGFVRRKAFLYKWCYGYYTIKKPCAHPFDGLCYKSNNFSTPTWQPVFGQYLARKVFVYVVYYLFTKEFKSYTHKYKFRVVKMVKRGFYLE